MCACPWPHITVKPLSVNLSCVAFMCTFVMLNYTVRAELEDWQCHKYKGHDSLSLSELQRAGWQDDKEEEGRQLMT